MRVGYRVKIINPARGSYEMHGVITGIYGEDQDSWFQVELDNEENWDFQLDELEIERAGIK